MKTKIKIKDTRYPRLTRAVLRRVDLEQLEDVARHGADAGWPGFTYYQDTVSFFKAHKRDILALLDSTARDLGEDAVTMVRGFNCIKDQYSLSEIRKAIFGHGKGEDAGIIRNALAWFALEEVARELNPDI